MKKILIGLIIFTLFNECSVNPVTGRKQLKTVSNKVLFPQSFAAYKETLGKNKISTNKAYNEQVLRVGKRIQEAVEKFFNESGNFAALANYRWEYKVIDSKKLNAWCMPGGKVAFYTGILPVCADDEGVAVVMGHEIAHAIANHGAERMSQGQLLGLGGAALTLGSKGASAPTQQIIMQAYGIGSKIGLLKYSRKQESEADEMGLLFMALAGYNPKVAPDFWERMKAISSKNNVSSPPEFLSTHPGSKTRIRDLKTLMPIANQVYKNRSIKPYLEAKKLGLI